MYFSQKFVRIVYVNSETTKHSKPDVPIEKMNGCCFEEDKCERKKPYKYRRLVKKGRDNYVRN